MVTICRGIFSSQKLSMDIQQSKLLCAAIRMMDKIEMYADSRYSEEGEIMFCYLVQNALLIVYVIVSFL